jgi:hypothetical protein
MADDTKKAESGADPESPQHSAEAAEDSPARTAASRDRGTGEELDPELLALPRSPRGRVGPVLAVSVVVFCVFIMVRIYGDLRFSRHAAEPRAYASAAELLQKASLEEFVKVHAVPDRTLAVKVAHSQADDGSRLVPVQGTDARLWIMIGGNVWTVQVHHKEVYSGRLRELAALPFADELRAHVRARGPIPRFVTAQAARQTLETGAAAMKNPAGDTFTLSADVPVTIYETVADRARVQVFATDRHPLERDWTAALAEIGLVAPDYQPEAGLNQSWIYLVQVPGGAEAAQRALHAAKLFSVRPESIEKVHRATWGELSTEGQTLVAKDTRLVWSNVDWIQVDVPASVPADARVLLTLEHPERYWHVTPLFVLLGLFALLFLWALVRSLAVLRR